MSIKDAFKKLTNDLADEKRKKTKQQQQKQLSQKAFSSKSSSGSNRDTGKHSNSVTPTKKQAATALKNAAASTGVTKGSSEKGVNATKVQADKFTGTSKTANQNRYINLKQGAGLYNDADMGFSDLKANSVRMSDSQKGNNNAKPGVSSALIRMANIQSKHLDRTVQATINAHNARAQKEMNTTSKAGNADLFSNTMSSADKSPKKQLKALNKDLPNIVNQLKNPATSAQTISRLEGENVGKQVRDKLEAQNKKREDNKADAEATLRTMGRNAPGADKLASAIISKWGASNKEDVSPSRIIEAVGSIGKRDTTPSKATEEAANTVKENREKGIGSIEPGGKIHDAWEETTRTTAQRDPITVRAINGKAPKGLLPGDKVVTNAGTYTIKGIASDGSYITDSTEYYRDASGKLWEKASNTAQTTYNTYNYDDPTTKRETTYKNQGLIEHVGDTAKALFKNALDKNGEKEQAYYDNLQQVNDDLQESFSALKQDKANEYLNGKHNHHYTALKKDSSYFETNPDAAAIFKFTKGEKAMYNYAYEKYGAKTAQQYFDYIVHKKGYDKDISEETTQMVLDGFGTKNENYYKELNDYGAQINKEFEPYKNNNFRNQGYLAYGKDSDYFLNNPEAAKIFDFTDEQKKRYNYVYQNYGAKAAKKYFDYVVYTNEGGSDGMSRSGAAAGSLYSVLMNNTVGTLAGAANLARGAMNTLGIGKYKPINQYSAWNSMSNEGNLVRSTISSSIKNPALRIAYNGVMSIADMAAQTFTFGAAGASASKLVTAAMSTGSANQSILDTLSRGGSQQQAFVNGFVNGVLEYVSESPAVEGLFSVGRGMRPIKDVKSFATSLLRQMGMEGFGEGFANVTQNFADQIIMGDKSNFGLSVQQYQSQGMSHDEAVKQAAMDMYVKSTAEAMATGALAGGVMGGAATGFNTVQTGRNINSNTAYAKDLAQTAEEIGLEGKYAETAKELGKGNRVSATDAANLKGAIQDYYQKETQNDIARFYNYVGLEAPHRLATAFGKASSRDETGFNNKKFTDAWLDKSTDMLMKINQYRATPNADLRTDIKEYLECSNALLYSGVLSEDGQFAAAVRAQANQVINDIPASAAGEKIVTNDSSLYEEDGNGNDNVTAQSAENTDADTAAENTAPKSVDAEVVAQGNQENNGPVVDITDEVVPLSESPASVQGVAESVPETTKTTVVHTNSATARNINSFSVGKKRGNTISYHKSANEKNGSVNVRTAETIIDDPNYDIVEESPRNNTVTFIYTNDFNSDTEPTVTKKVRVKLRADGNATVTDLVVPQDEIIVDKSEYVPLNYSGFDVDKQKARESSWKNSGILYDSSKLNNKKYFDSVFSGVLENENKNATTAERTPQPEQEENVELNRYEKGFINYLLDTPIKVNDNVKEHMPGWSAYTDGNNILFLTEESSVNIDGKNVKSKSVRNAYEEIAKKYPIVFLPVTNRRSNNKMYDADRLKVIIDAVNAIYPMDVDMNAAAEREKAQANNKVARKTKAIEQPKESSVLIEEENGNDESEPAVIQQAESDNTISENENNSSGDYTIDESSDGSTFTVYDPEGYYEDEFKSRKEAEEYVRRLSDPDKKDKKEDDTISETDKKSSEKGASNSQKVLVDDQNAKNYSENEAKNEETQISETEISETNQQPSFEDEYEIIELDELDKDASEEVEEETPEPKTIKIDMDKLRSNRAIAKDMKYAFDLLYDTPKSANQMGQIVKEVYEQVVEDGYYDLSSAADMFANQIENNRYIGEDLRTEEEKAFYQAVTHGNFKVDDIVKKEIVDYGDWQKANKNIILKSSPNGTQSIDNFYSSMESEYPEVFYTSSKITGDATTEGEMLVEMVAAAREIQDKMYTREGDVGTAFEGLDTEDISLRWAVKLGEVLSIAKADKKERTTKPKAEVSEDEGKDKKKPTGKSKKSASADEGSGKGGPESEKGDGSKTAEGHNESSDAEEKVSEPEPKIPTELKARGKKKSKQQSEPNKDNPLRGSLNDLQASKNYDKTDAAIKSIKAENRAVAENIGSIIKEIGKKMHVNIYSKRYRNRGNALGWFDTMHSQIHAQEQEQLGVVIHELGHKLDMDNSLNELAGVQEMLDNVPNLKAELKRRGYTNDEMKLETIADFVWKYLSEPDVAYEMGTYAKGRNFYDTFELALDKDTLKRLKSIRADVLAFTTKSTAERMRGQVRTREEVRAEDRIHIHDLKTPNRVYGKMIKGFDRAYGNFQENFVDSTWAASKVVKDIEKASGRKLTPKENLQLALEFSGSNASITDTLITRGFITPDGEITGRESLGQIIKETEELAAKAGRTSKQNAFDDYALYLVALHAIDRERIGQTTMSEDATGGDNIAAYEQLIRDMDRKYGDVFKKQAEKIYDWYDAFMRSWMVDTGMLQQDRYDLMRRMYPHYVPMFRVMDMRHSNGQVSKGVNPLKHNSLKGSTREIYNPLENMMIQVNNIVKAYHNNQVALTIHRLWTNEDKAVRDTIGQFISEVQVPLQKQEVNTAVKKDKLQEAIFHRIYNDVWSASDRGNFSRLSVEEQSKVIDEMTNKDLIDDAIEDIMVDFLPTDSKLDAQTVVALLPDGTKAYYRIQDEYLAKAITAVQPSVELLQHIGKLTRVFSALTTSQNPIFALSNAIRDFQHGWVYIDADKWYQNFTYPVEWGVALFQSLKNEFGGKHQSDMYKQYKSTTGFDSKFMSDADTLGDVMAQMRRARNPLIWATRFIERLNGAVESAPRYVAYKRKLATTGDVMTAGKAAREATVNFNRKGTATKQAGQLVPFLGAAVAGVNQFAELVTQPKKNAGKLARAMVTQAIPAILLAFLNAGWFGDDDKKRKEYDEMSEYTKNNYWVFKWGDTWLKLPRDREISAVFGTTFQNIVLDNIYPDERDESTMKELLSYLKEQFIPSLSPTGWALVQAHNNKTWYGSDLISSSSSDLLKNPETYMDVTDESTSEIANWLAKQINKGPEVMREWLNVLATPKGVDYVLDQLTGGLGDVILPLTTPAERWAGLGASLAAKYTFNEDKSSRYTSEAYDIKDKLTALKAADKITDEESEWLNAFTKTMSSSSGDDPDYKTVGDYFKDIRAYRNDLSMPYEERAEKMNEAYKHIADMTYDLVRAYKGGGTAQGSYAEKIIPSDIDTVGFTPETYTAAFNEVSKGDKSAKKLALAANTTLTDAQKEYLSQDVVGVRYDGYAKSYKKLADAGVTAAQITKAYNETKDYDTDKAKALSIVASGQDNAALLAVAIAGTSDDKLDSMVKVYQNAVKSGVTAEMYDGIMDSALAISKAAGKKGITKDGLISACKKAGYSSMQTLYIKQLYNPRWH